MAQLSHPYMTTGKTIALTRWTFVRELLFRKERHLRLREFRQVPAPQYAFLWQKGHEVCIPCHKTIDTNTGLLSHYQPKVWGKKKNIHTHTCPCRLFPPATRDLWPPYGGSQTSHSQTSALHNCLKIEKFAFSNVEVYVGLYGTLSRHTWKCTRVLIGSQKTIKLGYFAITQRNNKQR